MSRAAWDAGVRLAVAIALVVATASCGNLQGQSSSYLIVRALEGASGAKPGEFGGTLSSDVLTIVKGPPPVATVFGDPGRVVFGLGLKDPGPDGSLSPTPNNFITVDRYHVEYIRADGRNTQGVDVPYGFDGAITATVSDNTTVGFTLVRVQAKDEAPLRALASNGIVISTLAEVTFYGHDQTGRQVSVVGRMGIDFANFGDPQ